MRGVFLYILALNDIRMMISVISSDWFGTYQPGWRWSFHAGPQVGGASENHIGYVISGRMMVKDLSGYEEEIGPGFAFEIEPGSDAWVIGCVLR